MNKGTVRKVVIVVVVVFVLTLIAYPLLFSPENLEPGVDGSSIDLEAPGSMDADQVGDDELVD